MYNITIPPEKKNNTPTPNTTLTHASNGSMENNQGDSLVPTSNDSIKTNVNSNTEPGTPLEYPLIEKNKDFIEISIYNPDAGKETDLIYFYDKSYFELIGLYPEVTISNNIQQISQTIEAVTQTGGEKNNDEPSGPYDLFKSFMSYINPVKKEDTTNADNKEDTTNADNKEDTTNADNKDIIPPVKGDTYIPSNEEDLNASILSINPVTNDNTPDNNTENTPNNTPDNNTIINDQPVTTPTPANIIVLTFFPNEGIKSFTDVIETRNPELDIDITQSKYKFKELEKIKLIKEKKNLSTDVTVKEVYYINSKLIVLKGALNTIENGGVNMNTNNLVIDVKTEIANFMPEKDE